MSEQKFETDDPKCELCGTSLDCYENEGFDTYWRCPKCGNIENIKEW